MNGQKQINFAGGSPAKLIWFLAKQKEKS